jgi:hypothetical protein
MLAVGSGYRPGMMGVHIVVGAVPTAVGGGQSGSAGAATRTRHRSTEPTDPLLRDDVLRRRIRRAAGAQALEFPTLDESLDARQVTDGGLMQRHIVQQEDSEGTSWNSRNLGVERHPAASENPEISSTNSEINGRVGAMAGAKGRREAAVEE